VLRRPPSGPPPRGRLHVGPTGALLRSARPDTRGCLRIGCGGSAGMRKGGCLKLSQRASHTVSALPAPYRELTRPPGATNACGRPNSSRIAHRHPRRRAPRDPTRSCGSRAGCSRSDERSALRRSIVNAKNCSNPPQTNEWEVHVQFVDKGEPGTKDKVCLWVKTFEWRRGR
jgi:hypothetical protein